jgi:hypothetical protein
LKTALSVLGVAVALSAQPSIAHAQSPRVSGRVVVTGSDAGVPRVLACASRKSPFLWECAESAANGEFSLDSVPSGGELVFRCSRRRGLQGEVAAPRAGAALSRTELRIEVDTLGCDLRPLRRMAGVFAGHWSRGFEQSSFTPCATASWYVSSDTLGISDYARSAWLSLSGGDRAPGAPAVWPRARLVLPPWNYPEHFIRWRGTVIGPGRYGHMGVSGFEAHVDSILEVRTPASTDCLSDETRPNDGW